MSRILILLFCMSLFVTAKAQSSYAEAMQQGDDAFNRQEYKIAINKYFAAEAFDPGKKDVVKEKVNKVFDRIEALRKEAEKAKKEAEKAKKEAEVQKEIVTNGSEAFRLIILARQMADDDPTIALQIADVAIQKTSDPIIVKEAQKIYDLHAFYKTIKGNYFSACEIVPGGKKILTCNNGIITLMDLDGTLLKQFKPNKNISSAAALRLALSPDETMIITAGYDSTAMLWDFNGTLLKEFKNKSGIISSVSFSPDGKKIVTGCSDSTIYLWNIDGTLLKSFRLNSGKASSVTFSPDGTKILTGSIYSIPRLWDLNGILLKEFEHDRYFCGTFSPDGTKILIGYSDSTAKLWSIDGTLLKSFKVNNGVARSVTFSPDGARILVGSSGGTTNLWKIDGTLLKELRVRKRPGGFFSAVKSVGFSVDGTRAITYDGTLRSWNIEGIPFIEFNTEKQNVSFVAFSPDKTKIFIRDIYGKKARLFNMEGKIINEYKAQTQGDFISMSFSPDGKKILSGSDNGVARLWNLDGTLIKEFVGSSKRISLVTFSPDGTRILTGSSDLYNSKFTLWKVDGTQLVNIEDTSHSFYSAAFLPDGKKIIISAKNRHSLSHSVTLWDLNGKLIREFKGDTRYIYSVAFSPDGTKIITRFDDGSARLWSIDGTPIHDFIENDVFIKHDGAITSVAFSPDGKKILTCSQYGTARLMDLNGTLIWKNEGFGNQVISIAFSPDGTKIFTVDADGTVRVWNSIKPLREFLQHDSLDILTAEDKKEFGIK